MPRALWTGSVSFGLVNVPVRLYGATRDHDLHFHYVHEQDGSRIGYEKVCKKEGKPVPDDEIVKAFEWEKGEWVYMTDADFAAVEVEGTRSIDITDFVPQEEIDPIYFEQSYYLGPDQGGERVYALLVKALETSGLVAIAKFVMRDRQHLACLRIRDRAITLERMHFADEVLPADDFAPSGVRVSSPGARDGDRAGRALPRLLEAGEVQGHVPRAALRADQGEAQGRGDPRRARARAGGAA